MLEGGSIEGNGRGTLLTTEQCLLNPNRNPAYVRAEIEAHLREWLGVRHVLWLGEGIVGDDTDGHVDDITRFVGAHDGRHGRRGGSARRELRARSRTASGDCAPWPTRTAGRSRS